MFTASNKKKGIKFRKIKKTTQERTSRKIGKSTKKEKKKYTVEVPPYISKPKESPEKRGLNQTFLHDE